MYPVLSRRIPAQPHPTVFSANPSVPSLYSWEELAPYSPYDESRPCLPALSPFPFRCQLQSTCKRTGYPEDAVDSASGRLSSTADYAGVYPVPPELRKKEIPGCLSERDMGSQGSHAKKHTYPLWCWRNSRTSLPPGSPGEAWNAHPLPVASLAFVGLDAIPEINCIAAAPHVPCFLCLRYRLPKSRAGSQPVLNPHSTSGSVI